MDPSGMQDLETEIFLHLLKQHRAAIAGLAEDAEAAAAKATASSSDGMVPIRWVPPHDIEICKLHCFPRHRSTAEAPAARLSC